MKLTIPYNPLNFGIDCHRSLIELLATAYFSPDVQMKLKKFEKYSAWKRSVSMRLNESDTEGLINDVYMNRPRRWVNVFCENY